MVKKNKITLAVLSVLFYVCAITLLVIGGTKDLQIDINIFNPQSQLAISMEAFGQFVYWAMWGPLFSVLFLTAHTFNECLEMLGRVFPFIKPIKNTDAKAFKVIDKLVLIVWKVAFFVLGDIGWKKLIENVLKQFVDLSQVSYFAICAVVTAISILAFSRIDKKTLNKLEGLALAGLVIGICYKVVENCKSITNRPRFREMVAWSNGVTQIDDGETISYGELDGLKSNLNSKMVDATNFNDYTPWFKKGPDVDIYDHQNSFPSGHTTYSCTLFLSSLFCMAFDKLKKLAPIAFVLSTVYVAVMGYSRIVAGAHFLTDVVGGAIIGYTVFLIVCGIYSLFNKKSILPTREL